MRYGVSFGLAALCAVLMVEPACETHAAQLYTTNTDPQARTFRLVNQQTGVATAVNPSVTLPSGSWNGLSSLPTSDDYVVAVHNPTPLSFEAPQFSRLARINVHTGEATLLPLLGEEVLGFSQPFSTAVAVSPLAPSVAVVAGFEKPAPGRKFLYQVDVETGVALNRAVELQSGRRLGALVYSPDGSTLYGTDNDGLLVTVNSDTGAIATVGDPGLTDFITGLAFRPEDGRLFAIDGGFSDRLVELSPSDGSVVSTMGRMKINGPEGLAFVPVPEPSGSSLVLIVLVWIIHARIELTQKQEEP